MSEPTEAAKILCILLCVLILIIIIGGIIIEMVSRIEINPDLAGIIALIVLGVIGGIVGAYLSLLTYKKQKQKKTRLRRKKVIEIRKKVIEMKIKEDVKNLVKKGDINLKKGKLHDALKMYKNSLDIVINHNINEIQTIESKINQIKDLLNIESLDQIRSLINKGNKKQAILNSNTEINSIYNKFEKETGKKSIWKGEETQGFKKWRKEKLKPNVIDYQFPLFDYENALKKAHKMFDSQEKSQILKEINEKMNKTCLYDINLIKTQVNILNYKNNFDKSIELINISLKLLDKITDTEIRNKNFSLIGELIYETSLSQINYKINQADKLKNQKLFNRAVEILNEALVIIKKYDDALKSICRNIRIAEEIFDPKRKHSLITKINNVINQIRIAKIKSIIIKLGTQFGRLQVKEITEICGEEERLIISTIENMIENKEIYAQYFSSTKSVAFNLQANIEEIDRLMATYKEWEEKKVGKK